MMAGRGAFRAPPSVCGAVGGREGEAWGGGACALQPSPAPAHSVSAYSQPHASALPQRALPRRTRRHRAHWGAAQAGGRLPSSPPQGRQGAGLPQRPHNPRPMLPPPCVASVGWWGCQGVARPAMPSCVYKCCCV